MQLRTNQFCTSLRLYEYSKDSISFENEVLQSPTTGTLSKQWKVSRTSRTSHTSDSGEQSPIRKRHKRDVTVMNFNSNLSNLSSLSNTSNLSEDTTVSYDDVRPFLHRTLDIGLDDAKEAINVSHQLFLLFQTIHDATTTACTALEENQILKHVISTTATSTAVQNAAANNAHANNNANNNANAATNVNTTATTTTSSNTSNTTNKTANTTTTGENVTTTSGVPLGSTMERSLTVLYQHQTSFNASMRRCTLNVQNGASRSFNRIYKETELRVEELSERQKKIVEEHDRLEHLCIKASAIRTKSHSIWWNKIGHLISQELNQKNEEEWAERVSHGFDTETNNNSENSESGLEWNSKQDASVVCVVSCVKKHHLITNRLRSTRGKKETNDWNARDICVDERYVGWYHPSPLLTPTGGLQLSQIESIQFYDTNVSLEGNSPIASHSPCRYLVEITRKSRAPIITKRGLTNMMNTSKGGITSKTWSFGLNNIKNALLLLESVEKLLKEQKTRQSNDTAKGTAEGTAEGKEEKQSDRGKSDSGGVVGDETKMESHQYTSREEAIVEKRQATASHHIYIKYMLEQYKLNEYTMESRYAANSLVELQSQRQLFFYSILRSLVEKKKEMIVRFLESSQVTSTFVERMNSNEMLQGFIQKTLESERTGMNR